MKTQLDPLLEPLMAAVRRVERFLGPEDDWVEDDRRILFEAAQNHFGDYHTFIYDKGDQDYVTTVDATPDEVEKMLMPPYHRNLISSRKRRDTGGGKQYAVGSLVIDGIREEEEYIKQHHVYLFPAPDGGTDLSGESPDSVENEQESTSCDVYAHMEKSVLEGYEHVTDTNQENAAPHVLFDIFDRHGVEYSERQL